jgi:hypothetical protein
MGHAEAPDPDKVNDLATAISRAEGFGKRHTIPTRYHNPGDLKGSRSSTPLEGQVRIGKAGHIVFKDDEAGKAALRDYIVRMMDGRSAHFNPNLTLKQVARRYAENWRPWVKVVSSDLGVSPNTTLRAYFNMNDPTVKAPVKPAVKPPIEAALTPEPLSFRPLAAAAANPKPLPPPAVSFPESRRTLDAVLDFPVRVPPLVEEDVAQHHRLRLFHRAASDDQPTGTVRVVSSMTDGRPPLR